MTRRYIADIRYQDCKLEALYVTDYFDTEGRYLRTETDTNWTTIFQADSC